MENFTLEIGGLPLLICSEESSFMQLIAEKYQAFTSLSPALLKQNICLSSSTSHPNHIMQVLMNIRPLAEKPKHLLLQEKLWIKVSYHNQIFFIDRPDLEAEIDCFHRKAKVSNRAAIYSFDSFLRILYSLLLIEKGGFLLHAASVVKDGQGYIFMGKSGAGKSTVAEFSSTYKILSDEISLVRKCGHKYLLYSTPFWGEQEIKGDNFFAPIKGIFCLKKGKQIKKSPLAQREALPRLMENILYFAKEPDLTRQVFQNSYDFISLHSLYKLEFMKNNYFWDIVD